MNATLEDSELETLVIQSSAPPPEKWPPQPPGLAEAREERYHRRRARIRREVAAGITTPAEAKLKLDRTIWTLGDAAKYWGYADAQRVWKMRQETAEAGGDDAHPSRWPVEDVITGYVAGVPQPGLEAGRVRERLGEAGKGQFDPEQGEWAPIRLTRRGRPREYR